MNSSFKLFSIGGIDIYANWSWLIAVVIITWGAGDYYHAQFHGWSETAYYVVGFISALLLFATVLIHELAHSFTARANNLPVHTITLFIFGGVSNLTQEPPTPRIELLVAIAGPITSLVLAGIFFLLHAASGGLPTEVSAVLGYLAIVNLLLGVFNLIPGFPLDGGRVLRAILWMAMGNMRRATHIASVIGEGIGFLFIALGLLEAFVLGDIVDGIWLAFIGWFLHNAASASYQQAVVDRLLVGIDVRDVMDPPPPSTGPGADLEDLVYGHMLRQNQRAVPVNGPDGQLLGLVTLSDINQVPRENWTRSTVGQVMTPVDRLRTVTPDEHLRQAMQLLAENSYNQIPVVQGGRLVGVLNRAHVLQYLHTRQQLADQGKLPTPPAEPIGSER